MVCGEEGYMFRNGNDICGRIVFNIEHDTRRPFTAE